MPKGIYTRKPFSPETRKRMSEARKRDGVIPPNRKGIPLSETHKKNVSLAKQGEKNAAWKGGITPVHYTIRHSLEYRSWRLAVFERDKFTCQMPGCGTRGGRIEANHILKFSEHPGERFNIENGITLCRPCHDKTKGKEKTFEILFISIIWSKKQ